MPSRVAAAAFLTWAMIVRPARAESVAEAASRTYVHGMTPTIAAERVGPEGVPALLGLLGDPDFPRRDNVVAFLAYLGGAESVEPLLRLVDAPVGGAASPEEARALVLVPHALGRIAARGDGSALDALLALTAHGAEGERIGVAAAKGRISRALDDALLEEALAGLALSGSPRARERLRDIAAGRVVPDRRAGRLSDRASDALALMDEIGGKAAAAAPGSSSRRVGRGADALAPAPGDAPLPVPEVAYVPDASTRSHQHALTFANHVALTNPMGAGRLDSLLTEASRRAATGDYDGDVPCCLKAVRSGSGAFFGTVGDGLDTIDTSGELSSVLGVTGSRVKVVTAINYCGGAGTNIIGCANTPGSTMVLVRSSNLGVEAVLWLHEYGHNLGLSHAADNRDIMYGSDNGSNAGLLVGECQAFHAPPASAQASVADIGACTNDGDSLADPIDNCPLVANESQTDSNGNGIGDACESCPSGDTDRDGVCNNVDNCPAVANPGQADGDGDGDGDACDNCPTTPNASQANADGDALGDACDPCPADPVNNPDGDGICSAVDNCPATSNATQSDFDGDGFGDACETGALLADADLSGRVDGFDLARLGRAFGAASGDARYDADVDLDRNGQVDGSDLALLAPQFGKASF